MSKVLPLTPKKAKELWVETLPDFVIEAVNHFIGLRYGGDTTSFYIKQDELIKEMLATGPEDLKRDDLFEKHYLDFESIFEESGWEIKYDKPAYNESYEAYWRFKPNN